MYKLWVTLYLSLFSLIAHASNDFLPQTDVPALIFAQKLVLDLPNLPDRYEQIQILPKTSFMSLVGDIIDSCSFDAFIFINQPHLRKSDFPNYSNSFVSLRNYLTQSSTAFRFEKVELLDNSTFELFAQDLEDVCSIKEFVKVTEKEDYVFTPYLDTEKRIIRVDLPELPENTENEPFLRSNQIFENDKLVRSILGKIPSPYYAVVYTSLNPGNIATHDNASPIRIFSDIFKKGKFYKRDLTKNNRKFDAPPSVHNYKPKFDKMSDSYVTVFDKEFIEKHLPTLKTIVTVFTLFLMQQLIQFFQSNKTSNKFDEKPKKKQVTKKESKRNVMEPKNHEIEIVEENVEVEPNTE
ncbi:hypothetical protein TPHA_0H01610 [Tetrapisispora phaffii CBS 4417]|uniref:Protein BIG1 n=1 Tax=Tetrapisispora phaffii (strain ATCC 24235 / CBS 4417 / NBRC 1672 / NRRL Y-8282 / UCD 70-5) TaxID=1071381 RepID=G8BX63_TETPH|nr:hypothetical protein TPHA_0H01610 [Tetrapisispora phaffii CBS 4417]CCE64367.1 hypothetical protein TPHA_0H01610 [Tetrapisispora phaffii CBS 4417]